MDLQEHYRLWPAISFLQLFELVFDNVFENVYHITKGINR